MEPAELVQSPVCAGICAAGTVPELMSLPAWLCVGTLPVVQVVWPSGPIDWCSVERHCACASAEALASTSSAVMVASFTSNFFPTRQISTASFL
jgi:hypothetical protein